MRVGLFVDIIVENRDREATDAQADRRDRAATTDSRRGAHCLRAVELFDSWAVLGRLLLELRLDEVTPFRRFFREVRDELAGVLRKGQTSGEIDASLDAELAAATLIGAVDGLLIQHFLDPRVLDSAALRQALRGTVKKVLSP